MAAMGTQKRRSGELCASWASVARRCTKHLTPAGEPAFVGQFSRTEEVLILQRSKPKLQEGRCVS